ncbi:MAG TPA: amidase family protein, partial [Gillisia sp.]|nr:amidase family protein [Gillisia sp.]
MKNFYFILLFIVLAGCKENNSNSQNDNNVDSLAVAEREYKVLDSEYLNKDNTWEPFNEALGSISENRYSVLAPMILDKTIPELQQEIKQGDFTYEELVLFYLHRIKKMDRNNAKSLNSVISLNPNIIEEARKKDKELQNGQEKHPAFGIPVLLKDNINTKDMPTTAGAIALSENTTEDAYIVERLRENGALILGKANLSEWPYFFCGDCPSGYSAVGGQTLNPYGRKILDTGGSSSGSAVAVAANFAPAAIGSETS